MNKTCLDASNYRAGQAFQIDATEVARWAPSVVLAHGVQPNPEIKGFIDRAPARIRPPDIMFAAPQSVLVVGGRFAIISEQNGLISPSTYLFIDYHWNELFRPVRYARCGPTETSMIAGNFAWQNYYHWTLQCLAPVLVAQEAGFEKNFTVITPPLDPVRRAGFVAAEIADSRLLELSEDAMLSLTAAVSTNLTTGDFAFEPHPAIMTALEPLGRSAPKSVFAGRDVYIARTDATNRRMVNEATLCEHLAALGFAIVTAGSLSLLDQMALFRDATIVVAPHGAALTNLVYAATNNGPAVIELFQENYLNRAFLKICQAKGLRYTAILNRLVDHGFDRHSSSWVADIDALMTVLREYH